MGSKHSKDGGTKFGCSCQVDLRSQRPKSTPEVLQSQMESKQSVIAKLGRGVGSLGSIGTMSAESDSMSQGVPLIDIMNFLECPVCQCFIASPVYSCSSGHAICGICKPKIFKCPSCDDKNLAVNGLVERILKNKDVETACRNDYLGCTSRIKVWEMKEHLDDICDFRLIKCDYADCEEKHYAQNDLLKHWISFHGAEITEVEEFVSKELALPAQSPVALNMLGSVSTGIYQLDAKDYRKSTMEVNCTSWDVDYFKLDNQTFFIHTEIFENTFQLWITLLGDESEAKKYQFTCTVSKDLCTSQPTKEVTFRGILVHSQQYCDFEKVMELGHTVAIRVQNPKMLQDKELLGPDDTLKWNAEMELSKVGISNS